MQSHRIVILATAGYTTDLLFNELEKEHQVNLILEQPISRWTLIKGRINRIGILKTIGQLFFIILIKPFLSKTRIFELIRQDGLDFNHIPLSKVNHINSVNNPEVVGIIEKYQPDIIIVNGTRIISKEILEKLTIPIVNIHAGITPKYRGVHGGYWALYNNEPELFGVTLHFVNSGIDTGEIIAQKIIEPSKKDNFNSYPILQFMAGFKLLKINLDDIIQGPIQTPNTLTLESEIHYHPTFTQYLTKRLSKGLK